MKKIQFSILLFSLFNTILLGQMVSGTVLSESGFGAAEVSVSFNNKDNKVATKPDGSFEILATKLPDTLTFDAKGFEPYQVIITEETLKDPNFEIVMLAERAKLKRRIIRYDTIATFDPAAYSEEIKIIPVYEGDEEAPTLKLMREMPESGKAVRYDTVIVFEPETYEEKIEVVAIDEFGRRIPTSTDTYEYEHDIAPARTSPSKLVTVNAKKFYAAKDLIPKDKEVYVSGVLTAGEVNDFKKWNLWEDLTGNEFQSYSENWGIFPKNRYSVQLRNKQNDAVVGESVFLINKTTKDTVWAAVSDNTGKAELWSNFYKNEDEITEYQIVGDGFEIENATNFQQDLHKVKLNQSCQISDEIDLAFVVDATSSMSDELEFLKLELEAVIRNTFSKFEELDFRAASIFYRDKGDEYVTKPIDFQKDLLKILNFVKLQKAKGGGDYPEALHESLDEGINNLTWRESARTKLLFILSDAPPHYEEKESIQKSIREAAKKGIRIIPIACSGTNKDNEFLLRSMALATNGTYATLTNHSGIGNSKIEPTTDHYEIELLGTLLARIIGQFIYVKPCESNDNVNADLIGNLTSSKSDLKVSLYPNPTNGVVNLKFEKPIKAVYLMDFTGKILQKLEGKKNKKIKFSLKDFPSGTYLIKYVGENGWGVERVVFQR